MNSGTQPRSVSLLPNSCSSILAHPPRCLKAGNLTWYACGEALPADFGTGLNKMVLDHIKGFIPNFAPTTYEASRAYLDEEIKKPKGKRDLLREMCMVFPMTLPKDRKVYFVNEATKLLMPLSERECLTFNSHITTEFPDEHSLVIRQAR
jgi:hypothetical protein